MDGWWGSGAMRTVQRQPQQGSQTVPDMWPSKRSAYHPSFSAWLNALTTHMDDPEDPIHGKWSFSLSERHPNHYLSFKRDILQRLRVLLQVTALISSMKSRNSRTYNSRHAKRAHFPPADSAMRCWDSKLNQNARGLTLGYALHICTVLQLSYIE